jgi:voltage-gated potassium channel
MRVRVPRPAKSSRERFEANPASVQNAARLLIAATVGVVFVASLVVWIFDRRDYPDYGTALWFTLQTVTTVGYGDVTPTTGLGRVVAGVVMVSGIAVISIVTAIVTTTFYEAGQRGQRMAQEEREQARVDALLRRIDDVADQLARLEERAAREAPPARTVDDA